MRHLTIDERNTVDLFVRIYGASNLDVQCRKNKTSWTVGFRCYEPDSDKYQVHSAFRIPLDEFSALPEIISQIETHLNACIADPAKAHGKPVADGSAL